MFAKLANNRKLEDATSAKDEVSPVYLLEDITQQAMEGGEVAQGMADATMRRLGHKSPIVKQKVLRLIKYVCNKGAHDYRRAITKQAKEIRELTRYRGTPDAFKGDVPNQRVRDAAKEALDAIFAAQDLSYQPQQGSKLTNRIQGFGSSGAPGAANGSSHTAPARSNSGGFRDSAPAPSGASSSSGGMVGFGNPRFEGTSNAAGGSSGAKWLPTGLTNKLDSLSVLPKGTGGGMRREDVDGGYSSDDSVTRAAGGTGAYRQPQASQALQPSSLRPGARAAAGDDETSLVDSLCAPGGLRAQPDPADLRVFVDALGSLDGVKVAQLMQAKIERGSWQEVLRALVALEAVLQQGSTAPCGQVGVHFQANPEPVRKAQSSPQASVRQRAKRVLLLLVGDDGASSSSAAATQAAAAAPDLMGLGDAEPVPAAQAAPQQDLLGGLLGDDSLAQALPQQAPAASNGDMFSGLSMGAAAPGAGAGTQQGQAAMTQPSAMDALSDLQGPPQQAPPQTPNGAGLPDMFGGLSLSIPAAAVAAGSMSESRAAPGRGSGAPMGSRGAAPQAVAQQPAGDLFGNLDVAGSTAPSQRLAASQGGMPAASSSVPLDDLFSSLPPPQAPSHAAPEQAPANTAGSSSQGAGGTGPGGFNFAHMLIGGGQQQRQQPPFPMSGQMPQGMPSMAMPGLGFPGSMMGQPMGMMSQPMPGMSGMMPGMPFPPPGMFSGNPMAGLPGIPPLQMQYLQQQMQAAAGPYGGGGAQRAPVPSPYAGHPPFPAASAGPEGLQSVGPTGARLGSGQAELASAGSGKTDLLGRAISSGRQDTFSFVGDHISDLKGTK